jgi:broad-specificity NMP kinase
MEIQTRLIMVEGVPFTGKSTLSEFVAQQLRLNGVEAHWVSEGMLLHRHFPHVLASFDQQQSVSEAETWEDWSAFVQAIMAAPTSFVVDSALSYVAIFPPPSSVGRSSSFILHPSPTVYR